MAEIEGADPPSQQHNNSDLVVWALYALDGSVNWIDVETLFLKAFELAPARLAWRTRADIPDYKKCAKALQEVEDPKRSRHLGFFEKRGRYQRRLTQRGLSWCEEHASHLGRLYGAGFVPSVASHDDSRRLRDIRRSGSFAEWVNQAELTSPLWEIAEVFRCLHDSTSSVWNARLDEYLSSAKKNQDQDVISFIEEVRRLVQERA